MEIKPEDMKQILDMNPGMTQDEVYKAFEVNLDDCVLNALRLFEEKGIPTLRTDEFKRPIVVGSGNAFLSGKILFDGVDALVADESTYQDVYEAHKGSIDGAYVLSASGSKHSGELTEYFSLKEEVPTRLITCTENSDAEKKLSEKDKQHVVVTPKGTELYTYNTSTYMGWLFAKTQESPSKIRKFIEEVVEPRIPKNIGGYDSYFMMVPEEFDLIRGMYMIKFDELFQPFVSGQVFTGEQTTHAKTMIPSPTQLFIGVGYENERFGNPDSRLNIPLPEDIDFTGMMAIGYYIIGRIQEHKPQLFKEHLVDYCLKVLPESFDKALSPVIR